MSSSTEVKRKLVLKMSVSVDGFIAGPNGELDWVFRSTGGADSQEWVLGTLSGAGVHIMGSRSYHDMAAFWPYSEMPIAPPMNDIPKIVFSRTGIKDGPEAERAVVAFAEAKARHAEQQGRAPTASALQSWTDPAVASGDLVEEILRLKEQPGDYILAHGGVRFARSLIAAGLVDEYRLGIHPVALGKGQSLFSELRGPVDLRLISMTAFGSGAVGAIYRPA